jgi:hypothetical protein
MPLEKFAANIFGFSPPVSVSKKSATSRSIANRIVANIAWARSTSAHWPKKKLSASSRQHLQSKNSPIAGATYSSAAWIRSTSIFPIATVPVVTMPMPGMIMRLVRYRVVELLFKRRSPDSSRIMVDCEHPCKHAVLFSSVGLQHRPRAPSTPSCQLLSPGGYPQRVIVQLDLCLRRPATALDPVGRVWRAGNSRRLSRYKEALSIPGMSPFAARANPTAQRPSRPIRHQFERVPRSSPASIPS